MKKKKKEEEKMRKKIHPRRTTRTSDKGDVCTVESARDTSLDLTRADNCVQIDS